MGNVLIRVFVIYGAVALGMAALQSTTRRAVDKPRPNSIDVPTAELRGRATLPPPIIEVEVRRNHTRIVDALPPDGTVQLRRFTTFRNLFLPPHRRALTDGRRAALQAMLANDIFLLYIGPPDDDVRDQATRIPLISIGDSADPFLDSFVDDFNAEMLHAHRRGLIGNAGAQDVWFLAAHFRPEADAVFFELLDDPEDATVLRRDGMRLVVLDIGRRNRVREGTRFLLWTRRSSPRIPLAIVEVVDVREQSCAALVRHRFREEWPQDAALRASSPFYAARRDPRVRFLGDPGRLRADAAAQLVAATDARIVARGAIDVGIVGDFKSWDELERIAGAGAILVPARLVPWFVPSTQGAR
jgi:hypothetical protein